jgi:F1F0 ATPase subunit 2
MNETLSSALACLAGGGLGAVFFGGLWWTVRRGVSSRRPALWFICSGLLRTSIVLAGFYLVSGNQWKRALACLLGFASARLTVLWLTRQSSGALNRPKQEVRHAP